MKCSQCGIENPDGTQFCSECAAPLFPGGKGPKETTQTFRTPVQELSTGSIFAGRYKIIEELEKGGMGRIYKALDTEVNEKVALKLIKPEISTDAKAIERFRNELKYARKIGHRNVCRMFDLGKEGGNFYITMEYIAGEDLKSFIKRSGRLTVAKAVSLTKQVCGGLAEAHRLHVVHRDLKPKNIMIDTDGNARILDFGIARSLQTEGITGEGVMIGTPEYMSPEQVETKDVDSRSDIYSLGIILFEMLTGRLPFIGETPLSVAMKHKASKPPDPQSLNPQIPTELNRMILKCLEKDRNNRYQSVEEILNDLSEIESEIPTTETIVPKRRTRITDELTVTIGLKKFLIPIFAVVVVGILVLVILRPFQKKMPPPILSDKPSLAVMYFKNNTGDENFNHWRSALSDLLITDLSQSQRIRVLSAERLFNILNQLNQVEATTYSSDILHEVAKRGGVSNVLVGNFTKANGTFRINTSLQNANTGEVIASEGLQGEGEKSFYDMVDELTRKIKENFEFTQQEIENDIDKEVSTITTSSPEAYKFYSEGRKLHLTGNYPQSIEQILKALEIDPDFAMAHRSLSSSYSNLDFHLARRNAIEKAFKLSFKASDRERFTIAGDYYRLLEETFDKAIEAYEQLLELYPDDATGLTNLGLVYYEIENFDKAEELFLKNIENDAEGWIAKWNLAETYMGKGFYDQARLIIEETGRLYPEQSRFPAQMALILICEGKYDQALGQLEKALGMDSQQRGNVTMLRGHIYLLKGDFSKAEQEYKSFGESTGQRRTGLAGIYLSQGKYKEALNQLESKPVIPEAAAYVNMLTGNYTKALVGFSEILEKSTDEWRYKNQIHIRHFIGLTQVLAKDLEAAQQSADDLKAFIESGLRQKAIRLYYHLMGKIEQEKGNISLAIDFFNKAVNLTPSPLGPGMYHHPMFFSFLGQAYFQDGDLDRAQAEYEKIQSLTLHRMQTGDYYAKSYYWLGKIFQQKGERSRAVENYETFLDLWKDADSNIFELEDARSQLASLK